jgi:hypothetical protein
LTIRVQLIDDSDGSWFIVAATKQLTTRVQLVDDTDGSWFIVAATI